MGSDRGRNTRGVAWSAIERFSLQGSQFVVSLVVARLLVPSDYGVIAMMSIFMAVATALIDSGMAQALIQRQERSESDKTTALLFNVAVSVVLYLCIYISAPWIAAFYDTAELCSVARIYSIVLIINSLCVVQMALITIDLDFKRQAMASLSGVVLGGVVAIVLAYSGYGVWALVVQQIVSSVVMCVVMWVVSRWRPRGGFSWESFRGLSSFGSKIMLSGLIHVVYMNLYTIIIGKRFSSADLGLYNRATTISALPSSNISTIVDRALYPVLCAAQGDREVAAETMLRYLGVVCFCVFPMMLGIAVGARPLVLMLLGEQWLDVVPLLQAVAVANMWDPVMKFMGSMIRSQGRSGDFLRAETIKKICGVLILVVTLNFGVVEMCWGVVVYSVMDMMIAIYYARRISNRLGYVEVVRRLFPIVLMSVVMGGVVHLVAESVSGMGAMFELVVLFVVGVGVYVILGVLSGSSEIRSLRDIIKERII